MIKTNKGMAEMSGSTPELLADFSTITNTLYQECLIEADGMSEDEAKDTIQRAVEMGLEPEKCKDELEEKLDKVIDALAEILGLKGMGEE